MKPARNRRLATAVCVVIITCGASSASAGFYDQPVNCPGDINGDGLVDMKDVYQHLPYILGPVPSNPLGDADLDNDTDLKDYVLLQQKLGYVSPGGAPIFPVAQYHVSKSVASIVVADLNADGWDDFLVADPQDDGVKVALSDGRGGFLQSIAYETGGDPAAAAVGDVTGDGHLDIVVVNEGSSTISLLEGQDGGGFAPHVQFPVGGGPVDVALADLDGDEDLDAVVANADGDSVKVLLNTTNFGITAFDDIKTYHSIRPALNWPISMTTGTRTSS